MKLLDVNDNVMEKAFVYAILLLSLCVGDDLFPWGVHEWPPPSPMETCGKYPADIEQVAAFELEKA